MPKNLSRAGRKCTSLDKNHVIDQPSFSIRPTILGIRMYDEYTTSNVESEHACIKSQSVGLTANSKVTSMFEKLI